MHLPELRIVSARLCAREDQHLAPLPSTSVHGALLASARGLVCSRPELVDCAPCERRTSCPYPEMFEPALQTPSGAQADAPAPLALRASVEGAGPLGWLGKHQALRVELTLIGRSAITRLDYLRAAMQGVALRGIGLASASGPGDSRPELSLESFVERPVSFLRPSVRYRLELTSPLRVKAGGEPQTRLAAHTLWPAIVRRVRTLGGLYGVGPPELPFDVPFQLGSIKTKVAQVTRHSSRQHKKMSWPGLLGTAVLEPSAPRDEELARVLAFVQDVQLGSGTLFGCGVIRVEETADGQPTPLNRPPKQP